MRLVGALMLAALTGSAAFAEEVSPPPAEANHAEAEAKPAAESTDAAKGRVPLRVVRMLPETRQVLLIDKNRGTHVVAEVGQDIDGYIVDDITADEVTLVAPSGAEVILTAPDLSWRRRAAERKAAARKAGSPAATVVTADPPPATEGPVDPYADPSPAPSTVPAGSVRVASASGTPAAAPADPYADADAGIAAFAEAVGAQPVPTAGEPPAMPAASSPASPGASIGGNLAAAVTGSPAPAASTTAPAPATPTADPVVTLARADLDAALSDFGATAVTFDAKFVADGLHIDSVVAGTILAKAGLRKGDTITSIDGKPLHSFDDAADLYARLQTARTATVALQRGGKPVTLKVAIR